MKALFQKGALTKQIEELTDQIDRLSKEMTSYLKMNGFQNAKEFYREIHEVRDQLHQIEEARKPKQPSMMEKLARYQKRVDEKKWDKEPIAEHKRKLDKLR